MGTTITTKWFDRTFSTGISAQHYKKLYLRLQKNPIAYKNAVAGLQDEVLNRKPEGKWSIKENIGHLLILEPLWLKRLMEIKAGITEMSPADLSNTATDDARFNNMPVSVPLEQFIKARAETMAFLDTLKKDDFRNTSIHPRLRQPMSIVDFMNFIAEHDDHHLETIQLIIKNQNT